MAADDTVLGQRGVRLTGSPRCALLAERCRHNVRLELGVDLGAGVVVKEREVASEIFVINTNNSRLRVIYKRLVLKN